ncbi:hypothetical protein [Leptothoe spongobia]|uniref:Class I SAM-dependent methyltransferase n=1 Tax=Leptothoe spongobia TAU-MAC 1115 TaxID=1967444 RepID=A0A947GRZ3_9CYAN|nr:hypothetical protein [Leptothoe spongobia]MBT9317711.1 class I SAM-dependent methyltransferase [Leptothoe spongobia TAU-MAC 1115]
MTDSDYQKYCDESMKSARLTTLFNLFEEVARGKIQAPQQPIEANLEFLSQDPDLVVYHDLLQKNMGHFYKHYCASVPFITEELCRLGIALCRFAQHLSENNNSCFTYYETSGADGAQGNTIAEYSHGLIKTLTDSPTMGNKENFYSLCNHNHSKFYHGGFFEMTPELIASKPELDIYTDGFDFIYTSATFQFYGSDRVKQLKYLKRLLKEDGLMIVMEKLRQPTTQEYERLERIKDEKFKSRYFSEEENKWKDATFVKKGIEVHQVDFNTIVNALKKHFKYGYLTWNSTNFYEFVVANNESMIQKFISLLPPAYMPAEFCAETNFIRKLF